MKPTLINLPGLLAVLCLFAFIQAKGQLMPRPPLHAISLAPTSLNLPAVPYNPFVTFQNQNLPTLKTTGAKSRILSEYSGVGTGAGVYRNKDSVFYTYSNGRGGDLNSIISYDAARYFRWDTVGSMWKPTYLYTFTYDAQNRPVTQLVQAWTGTAFVNSSRYSFSYDASGRPMLLKTESWNSGTNSWVNYLQYTGFTYNAANRPTSYILQNWKGASGPWTNNARYSITYNTGGNPTLWLTEIWNATASVWENFNNEIYSYNAANKNTGYTHQSWDNSSAKWKNDYSYTYYYNGANYESGYVYRTGDLTGVSLINVDSISNTSLNTAGLPLNQLSFSWTGTNWVSKRRYTMTYTSTNLESSSLREDWNGSAFVNKVRDYSIYNSFGQLVSSYGQSFNGNWGISSGDANKRFGYQNYATSVSAANAEAMQAFLYPVPTKGQVQVDIQWKQPQAFSLTVYDLNGRVVKQRSESPISHYQGQLDLGYLAAGDYILLVQGSEGKWQMRFSVFQ